MMGIIDGVIETVITGEALHLAHEAAEPTVADEVAMPEISESARAAFAAQNEKARRIVAEMREKREIGIINDACSAMRGQTSIFEFR